MTQDTPTGSYINRLVLGYTMRNEFYNDKVTQYISSDLHNMVKFIKTEYKKRYKGSLTTAAVLDLLIDGDKAVNDLKLEFKGN